MITVYTPACFQSLSYNLAETLLELPYMEPSRFTAASGLNHKRHRRSR